MTIRPERPEDAAAIDAVQRAAFEQPDEAGLVAALRGGGHVPAGLSFVAEDGGRVVGHVLFSRARLEPGGEEIVALAPLAVLPEHQRRGLGAALVEAGIDAARERGERLIVVVGEPGYYGRFGFAPARPLGVIAPFSVPDEAWQALALEDGWSGGGTVAYAPPFDALT